MSGGNPTASCSIRSFTASATASAFAPGVSWTAIPAAGSPFISTSKPYVCAPSSTRATSPSRITEPSGSARRMTLANCSGVVNRLWVRMVALSSLPSASGRSPSEPPLDWLFCSCTACSASEGDRLYAASFAGSSQIRIAYSEENERTSPTPGMRRSSSTTRATAKLPSSSVCICRLFDVSATIIRKPAFALSTCTPCRRTSSGRRASTRRSRFWTSIRATLMSVPDRKVTEIDAAPFDELDEDMYWNPSTPFSSCSIGCVTLFARTLASAPG
jgi:hypothetical protein